MNPAAVNHCLLSEAERRQTEICCRDPADGATPHRHLQVSNNTNTQGAAEPIAGWVSRCEATTPAAESGEQLDVWWQGQLLNTMSKSVWSRDAGCWSVTISPLAKTPQLVRRVKISVWGNKASCWREEQLLRAHQADEKNIIHSAITDIIKILRLRSDRWRWRYLALQDKNWNCDTNVVWVFGC